jgi:hypothetical protein
MKCEKHSPVPEETLLRSSGVRSICQMIRKVYLKTEDQKTKDDLLLICGMAKDLSKKISNLTGDDSWIQGYWDMKGDGE